MRWFRTSLLCSALLLSATSSSFSLGEASGPSVQLPIGTVYGIGKESTHEFLGIQFATSERWSPPKDVAHKQFPGGSYQATKFGPCCLQQPTNTYIPNQKEDCLYLNVFAPAHAVPGMKLPVLFWIYGGGLKFGCSAQGLPPLYNGTNLVARAPQDVIVVTINYRLGIFANAYFEGETLEDPSWPTGGNYQVLDVLSALRWVKANIASFGGDPSRVTSFGQSAGGNLGINLLTVNRTESLISAVISESGTPMITPGYLNTSMALSSGEALISQAGCSSAGNPTEQLKCMRRIDAKELLKLSPYAPALNVVDGVLFTEYPAYAMQNGNFLKVPVLMGNNEPDNFPACASLPNANATVAVQVVHKYLSDWGVPEDDIPTVISKYKLPQCSVGECCDIMTRIMLDYTMICNARRVFNLTASKDPNSGKYWYRFFCTPECPASEPICQHTSEIEYVFGTVSNYESQKYPNCTWNTTVRYFSDAVISQWTWFASHGVTITPWSPWTPKHSTYTDIIEPSVPGNIFQPREFEDNDYCDMWDNIDHRMAQNRFGNNMERP